MKVKSLEIERKFFPKHLPDLTDMPKVSYERYFLYNADGIEIRIQKKGDGYEFERKVLVSPLSREQIKFAITKAEFLSLKTYAIAAIFRDRYTIPHNPEITVNIYHGRFAGLVRVEVEFENEQDAKRFKVHDWLGAEITHTQLVRDALLVNLSDKEFKKLLATAG